MIRDRISVALLLMVVACTYAKLPLPSYITKCTSKEQVKLNACAKQNARSVLAAIGLKGDKKYGIPPINPSKAVNVKVQQNGLDLEFDDVTLQAHPEYTIDEVEIDLERKHVKVMYSTPLVTFVSKYRLNGRLLLLSLKGDGNCTLTFENYKATYDADFNIVKDGKDGEDYIKLKNTKYDFTVTKAGYQFENLFNGDKTLGEATNEFLNKNWKEIFAETKGGTLEVSGMYITTSIQNFFDKVPYKDLFPL